MLCAQGQGKIFPLRALMLIFPPVVEPGRTNECGHPGIIQHCTGWHHCGATPTRPLVRSEDHLRKHTRPSAPGRNASNGSSSNSKHTALDPTIIWCLKHKHLLHPAPILPTFRAQILQEMKSVVEDLEPATHKWLENLPQRIRHAYQYDNTMTPVPDFTSLLDTIGHP